MMLMMRNSAHKGALIIILLALLGIGAYFLVSRVSQSRQLIASTTYFCDGGKSIAASYYDFAEAPVSNPGERPMPTGSVEISLDGGPTITLNQTISGSGVRYANDDESFVFWNKGSEALVMRNNSMNLDYTNCISESN